jgi:hypothetical protein
MRILILEDKLIRIEKFKKLFKNQAIYICTDLETAKNTCKYLTFDIFWLDHDLKGSEWENSFKEETGYQFVKWMVEEKLHKNALIYIHSMNVVGANLMLNYLRDNDYNAIWVPFHTLKIEDK